MSQVTQILSQIEANDPSAAEQLLPLVYDELRQLAAAKLFREKPGQTFQATALVHEAYLRLVGVDQAPHWDGRRHFFAAAAEAMRRILVDRARRKACQKHGGGMECQPLEDWHWVSDVTPDQVLLVDECLQRLGAEDALAAEVVKLRYFAGMSNAEAAESLGIHRATANRHWSYARAWIRAEARVLANGERETEKF